MGDGREPLHVATAEHPADGRGLGLAQLGELVGHVGDRAVLLAQLLPHREVAHRGGVPLVGEDLRQRVDGGEVRACLDQVAEALLDLVGAPVGELADGFLATGLVEEADRLHSEVVVGLVEPVAPGSGQCEHLGRSATSADAAAARLPGLQGAVLEEVVQVTAYGGRGELETLGERRSCGGAVDHDRPHHTLARGLVVLVLPRAGQVSGDFHNTSVPLMPRGIQIRRP